MYTSRTGSTFENKGLCECDFYHFLIDVLNIKKNEEQRVFVVSF